ncbi:CHAT domain-containing protein [Laspinema olomoucense]|uniref:CHAT domain-containing protein n=1 Tax=Laspinema olomoucense TaxID=3231600 RepID=UPI0021BB9364|nr:CHAT domain-containing protein [Laspinema sp. D3d]
MKRRDFLRSILFFTVAAWASASYGQGQPDADEAVRQFNLAAVKHKRELRDLFASRGSPFTQGLKSLTIEDIARVLSWEASDYPDSQLYYPEKTAILFYAYEANSFQTWLLDKTGIKAYHQQPISSQQIEAAATQLVDSLNLTFLRRSRVPSLIRNQQAASSSDARPQSRESAIANMTQILLPTPVTNALDEVEHLIVVPVLGIGTVPYPILKPFGDDSFLVDKMSVSIAPSLFDIVHVTPGIWWDDLISSPLVVGNPYLPRNEEWFLPPLLGAEQEAQAIAKMITVPPLIGKAATKDEILSKVEEASLLYFAAHGIASSEDPLENSFLMLSAETFEQGWWTAREIQNTRLRASLAVLSACQTGLGQAHDAGIIGLSRAFQIAGVPKVVMSLWSVDDEATNYLMQAFMKHLQTGTIASEALRQAMLETKAEYPEPLHWASFALFGTPQ